MIVKKYFPSDLPGHQYSSIYNEEIAATTRTINRVARTHGSIHPAQDFDRTCTHAGGIRFGVWVNISLKGFRMKTIDFSAAGMSTDVPRPLSGASVAVRNIFVPYGFVPGRMGDAAGELAKAVVGGTGRGDGPSDGTAKSVGGEDKQKVGMWTGGRVISWER